MEQYFTMVLFVNPLTPRVKPWVIQSFQYFTIELYFTVVLFFNFSRLLILYDLSILDLALSGMKGLKDGGKGQ